MGASRKLQGEIDRVLKKVQEGVDVFDSIWNKVYDAENANQKEKFEADLKKEIKKLQRYRDQIKTWLQSSEIKDKKVSASYEQYLTDARKSIEREMERFKICEKETKTKAFSKEGLGQQPKTDPKEKAKAESRDWLNNVVADLESQIESFEAEAEGLSISIKKGKTRPPRLIHLEKSITRHKAHIKKLESILRLLDNDELSPEEVNDVKDYLEDYVERNQDDFDEFSDVDDLYSSLPQEKVDALEDIVSLGPSTLSKTTLSTSSQGNSQDQSEETASQDSNSDLMLKTPPSKSALLGSLATGSSVSTTVAAALPVASGPIITANVQTLIAPPISPAISRASADGSSAASLLSLAIPSSTDKEDNSTSLPARKASPAISETGAGRGNARGMPNLLSNIIPVSISSGTMAVNTISTTPENNLINAEDKIAAGSLPPQLVSPVISKVPTQQSVEGTGAGFSNNVNLGASVGGNVLPPVGVSGAQWRPQMASAFQNQTETSQFRGRPEIAPDQREKFLQKFQQVQQQSQNNLSLPHLQGLPQKQMAMQQHILLLQQSPSISAQSGLGLGRQTPGIASAVSPSVQQPPTLLQQSSHLLIPAGAKDGEFSLGRSEEQIQARVADESRAESAGISTLNKNSTEDDLIASFSNSASFATTEGVPKDMDPLQAQPLQSGTPLSSGIGIIGRRSAPDLGAIGDIPSGTGPPSDDYNYNLQLLEAAFYKLPQSKDSERVKSYLRQPAVTPASFPQVQSPIFSNPIFWEKVSADAAGSDIMFFAFYYQKNSYQQYLAARELKKQSWRFHRKYNTWFQRNRDPDTTNDEYERGSYVYFDYHFSEDGNGSAGGWCQRIRNDFEFEYKYLEDEL